MTRDTFPIEPEEGLDIFEIAVSAHTDNYQIPVRVYRPTRAGDTRLPVLVYIHGGGWVTGSLETDDHLCRNLARHLDIVVLNVAYRLAPEHPFPVGFEDSYDVVKWCATSVAQQKLKVDVRKGFLLGGTSAGGNFTAGIASFARDEKLQPPLTGLLMLAGNVTDSEVIPTEFKDRILSLEEITDSPGLSKAVMEHFAELYKADPGDKRRSPLLFDSYAGLATKAVVVVCGWDPRRDEMLVYEELLRKAGTSTKLKVYAGLSHGFWTVCRDLPTARQFDQDMLENIKFLLSTD